MGCARSAWSLQIRPRRHRIETESWRRPVTQAKGASPFRRRDRAVAPGCHHAAIASTGTEGRQPPRHCLSQRISMVHVSGGKS
jgi:hypothetical protein